LALSALLHGCESCAIREQDKSRTALAEMKFMRITAKHTWKSYKTNKDILSELKTNPVAKKVQNYRNKWIQHIW